MCSFRSHLSSLDSTEHSSLEGDLKRVMEARDDTILGLEADLKRAIEQKDGTARELDGSRSREREAAAQVELKEKELQDQVAEITSAFEEAKRQTETDRDAALTLEQEKTSSLEQRVSALEEDLCESEKRITILSDEVKLAKMSTRRECIKVSS
jgi:chromosome segregation ATPase